MRWKDITGKRFGRLIVEKKVPHGGAAYFLCTCDCGNQKIIRGANLRCGDTKSCGCLNTELRHKRKGKLSPTWKHGNGNQGYVIVCNAVFPGATFPNRTLEHVVVMSRYLGRRLHSGETVHHKNGIRNDNDIKNLELWSSRHPKGQRVQDLIAWAKDLLKEYGDCDV